jgi:hypothetical protein
LHRLRHFRFLAFSADFAGSIAGSLFIYWPDLNGSFVADTNDIDIMMREVTARIEGSRGGYNWRLDINADDVIDEDDADDFVMNVVGTRYGDLNLDYRVDDDDFEIFADNFGTGSSWAEGDLNGDGQVDLYDWVIFDTNYPWP